MRTKFESAPRATTTSVTTAAILVVMLAMGASTLLPPNSAPANGGNANLVAQSHSNAIKKS